MNTFLTNLKEQIESEKATLATLENELKAVKATARPVNKFLEQLPSLSMDDTDRTTVSGILTAIVNANDGLVEKAKSSVKKQKSRIKMLESTLATFEEGGIQ